MDFTNQKVIVTGGFRGIGKAVCDKFLALGATVSATYYKSEESARRQIEESNGKLRGYKMDLADRNSVNETMEKILADFGGTVDILVNNGGISQIGLFAMTDEENLYQMMNTDFFGSALLCKKVILPMMENNGGAIVNISSIAGVFGSAGQVEYSSAKSALIGLTLALSREMASKKIRVNAVAPGFIDTDMVRALPEKRKKQIPSEIPMGRMGTPEDVANAVCFLASCDASYITGQVLVVDGGAS